MVKNKMKSAITVLFVLSLLLVSQINAQKISESDEIIKIETALVSVPVIVSDRNGRYIPNLQIQDFSVYQDGQKQEIAFFADEKEPLNVAVLIDTSLSTARVIDKIKRAAIDFIYLLEPQDSASIITFDSNVNTVQQLTSNRIALERAVRGVYIGYRPGTVMRDAVLKAAETSLKNVKGRKAIILLTDGQDFGSYETPNGLLNTLEESDTLVYSIFYKTEMPQRRQRRRGRRGRNPRGDSRRARQQKRMNKEAEKYLKTMSKLTAGRFFKGKVSKLRNHFISITNELRNQYRLGYYPEGKSASGTVHKIRVKVTKKKSAVRARSTYRVK